MVLTLTMRREALCEVELGGVEVVEGAEDLDAHLAGIEEVAVGDCRS